MNTTEAVERLRRMEQHAYARQVSRSLGDAHKRAREHALDAEALRLAIEAMSREKP